MLATTTIKYNAYQSTHFSTSSPCLYSSIVIIFYSLRYLKDTALRKMIPRNEYQYNNKVRLSVQPKRKAVAYAAAAAAAGYLASSPSSVAASEAPARTPTANGIHETLWGSFLSGDNEDNDGLLLERDLLSIPRGGSDDVLSEAETDVKPSSTSKKKKRRNKKNRKSSRENGKEEKGVEQKQTPSSSGTSEDSAASASNSSNKNDDNNHNAPSSTASDSSKPKKKESNPMMEGILKSEDYYDILGLPRGEENENRIKKNYRRRAVRVHPDKTGGDRRAFDKLAEAYDVLLDGEKRSVYNRFGKAGLDPTKGGAGMTASAEDLFRSFFGGGPFGQTRQQQQPRANRTLRYQLEVTLEDLYRGFTRRVTVKAPTMMGGWHYNPYEEDKSKEVEVSIPRGSHAGQSIVLSGEMDFDSKDSPPGDLVFQIHQRPHKTFTRKGHDLAIELKISFQEAVCGCTRTIRHLDGRELILESAKHKIHSSVDKDGDEESTPSFYIQTGDVHVLKGQGMPKDAQGNEFGDLYVQYQVELPKSGSTEHLTTSERIELARLLEKLEKGPSHHHLHAPHFGHKKKSPKAGGANHYTLERASVRDFGRASGPVPTFEDDHHDDSHNRHHHQFPFGAGTHRQFFWSSSGSGRSPFFGQENNFDTDDENVQCRQM